MCSQTHKDPAPIAWDAAPATDFAITTINVPDRLDLQEVRAREAEDEYYRRPRFALDRYTVGLWGRRTLAVGVLAAAGWLLWTAVASLLRDFSEESIAARLSAGTGAEVTVAGRDFSLWPQPRLVLRDLRVDGLAIGEVSLQLRWSELVFAVRTGRWSALEAVVGPMQLTAPQSFALIALAPRLTVASAPPVAAIRLSEVSFPDFPLLPGKYEVVLRRPLEEAGQAPVTLTRLEGEGQMRLQIAPGRDGSVEFQMDAQDWRAPVGPAVTWNWVNATGRGTPQWLIVDSYAAASSIGVAQGLLVAASDVAWSVAGTAKSVDVDLPSLLRHLSGARADAAQPAPTPLTGTASVALSGGGHGATLSEAVGAARLAGPVSVRWGALNGVNLGVAATRGGGASGGLTRFTQLGAEAELSSAGLTLDRIVGRAGALATQGRLTVAPDLSLDGRLRVDLGSVRVQAPATLRVGGTALAPRFIQ